MSEPIVAMEFAGCEPTEASRDRAMWETHDNLIARYPKRIGPVEWHFYEGGAAAEKLRLTGVADDRGLLGWLAATPGAELLIASVLVPADAARLTERLTEDDVLRRMQ